MTGKLRVMFVVNQFVMGGAERQLVELARRLDRGSFEVHVVTLEEEAGVLEAELANDPTLRLTSLRRSSKLDVGAIRRLAGMLREDGTDVLHPFLTPATFYAFSAGLIARTPILVLSERSGARIVRRPLGNQAFRFAERLLGRFADTAVPNSKAGAALLRSRGVPDKKIRVIYNGVNPDRLRPLRDPAEVREALGIDPAARLAGIVARLDEAKDHATLLHAVTRCRESVPGLVLLVVGDGQLRSALTQLTSELGIEASVHFLGNQADVASLIGALDLAVLSSKDSEGSSNFLLEAMGLGTPIVATDIGGNRELIENGRTGVLVQPGNPITLAAAMASVLQRPDLGGQLGLAALEDFGRRFTLERMVSDYEELYRQMARKKGLREERKQYASAA